MILMVWMVRMTRMVKKFAVVETFKLWVDRGVCGRSIISDSGVLGWASAFFFWVGFI